MHPWSLGELPPLPPDTLVLGVFVREFHRAWPWSERRWRFVGARLAELAPNRWHDDAGEIGAALAGARRVRCLDEPHLAPWLSRWAECVAAPALFAPVSGRGNSNKAHGSFSRWWNQATRGLSSATDLLAVPHGAGSSESRFMTSIALITGASGGIGRALARQLTAQGCRVAAVGRDASRLADVEAAVRIAADTTTPEGAALAVAACQEALGAAPTLLAHCVGSTLIAPLHRTRVDAYREVMRVNLDSAVFMLQAWIAALQGGAGSAVFASSVVARIGVANHEAIAAAKGGVEALVRSAAATYAAQGLRVNAVAPGMTETPMTAGMLKLPAMREGAGRQYPLGGVQTADQVADVMAWLLGDGAARLTGQVIAVDGGFTTVRPLAK